MGLGGILALSDRRYRLKRKKSQNITADSSHSAEVAPSEGAAAS